MNPLLAQRILAKVTKPAPAKHSDKLARILTPAVEDIVRTSDFLVSNGVDKAAAQRIRNLVVESMLATVERKVSSPRFDKSMSNPLLESMLWGWDNTLDLHSGTCGLLRDMVPSSSNPVAYAKFVIDHSMDLQQDHLLSLFPFRSSLIPIPLFTDEVHGVLLTVIREVVEQGHDDPATIRRLLTELEKFDNIDFTDFTTSGEDTPRLKKIVGIIGVASYLLMLNGQNEFEAIDKIGKCELSAEERAVFDSYRKLIHQVFGDSDQDSVMDPLDEATSPVINKSINSALNPIGILITFRRKENCHVVSPARAKMEPHGVNLRFVTPIYLTDNARAFSGSTTLGFYSPVSEHAVIRLPRGKKTVSCDDERVLVSVQHELQHMFDAFLRIPIDEYTATLVQVVLFKSDLVSVLQSGLLVARFSSSLAALATSKHAQADKRIVRELNRFFKGQDSSSFSRVTHSAICHEEPDEQDVKKIMAAAMELLNREYKRLVGLTYDQIIEPFAKLAQLGKV